MVNAWPLTSGPDSSRIALIKRRILVDPAAVCLVRHCLERPCEVGPTPKRRIAGVFGLGELLRRNLLALRNAKFPMQSAGMLDRAGNPMRTAARGLRYSASVFAEYALLKGC